MTRATRGVSVLLAVALIVVAVVLFVTLKSSARCTHGVSSAGPVTIIHGQVRIEGKTYTRACLL